jgi:lipoprotein-anchoring transpeptidase ErfK/SrfK
MTDLEIADHLSRREFLRLSTASLLGMAVPLRFIRKEVEVDGGLFGRVVEPSVDIHLTPSFVGEKLARKWRDEVLPVEAAVIGDRVPEHNRIWYLIKDRGYVHSSGIQPVRDEPNEPILAIPASGLLMEISVPYVEAYWRPRTDGERAYRFYYGSTHWIVGVSRDVQLNRWYRIRDDRYTYHYYAPAEAFRPIPEARLAPITPDIPLEEKRIVIDLTNQWVHCFEGEQAVFSTKVSTGRRFGNSWFLTPQGEFITFRKRPSRHMAAGNLASGYDLPGVPWVAYITKEGIAFHGTYWHNDFGTPRSHGCINMTLEASNWLYRWSRPTVPFKDEEVWVNFGTQVLISL